MYTQKVMDNFLTPQNVGEILNANGMGCAGDLGCGDYLQVFIRIENEIIEDISYLVYGCAAAIATSSMITCMVKGQDMVDALAVTEEQVSEELGGLPEDKMHCSNLGVKALHDAVENYVMNEKGGFYDENCHTDNRLEF